MSESHTIRRAVNADLPVLTEIYNHYVVHSHATFRSEPLALEECRAWLDAYTDDGPYRLLVVEADGGVAGYAACGPYRQDPGFEKTAEVSVYLAPTATSRGYGRTLYQRLFAEIDGTSFHRILAGIALPNDASSVRLHRGFGFREVGTFSEYGHKFGRYWSSLWLEKEL
jgi:phosphinothricin acetyltransferase